MPQSNRKIICDPIHGYVHLDDLENEIANTKIFLRLQQVRQSPTVCFTYPSNSVNRFVHSLGTMELAGKMAKNALENSPYNLTRRFLRACSQSLGCSYREATAQLLQLVRLAGLLHDIGHPPFSHQGESALDKKDLLYLFAGDSDFKRFIREKGRLPKFHEFTTFCIIRDNQELNRIFRHYRINKDHLLRIFGPRPEGIFSTICHLISSEVDADRADFMLRDGTSSGLDFGQYDVMRLVESMQLYFDSTQGQFTVVPSTGALSTVESFIVERYKIYKWLCFHPHVILTDTVLSHLMRSLLKWSKIKGHPLSGIVKRTEFHYSRYAVGGKCFDDALLIIRLRNAFTICESLVRKRSKWKSDLELAYVLLRILLFREKFYKAVFKNISDYRAFDSNLKDKMRAARMQGSDSLPESPLLNIYAKTTGGTTPLRDTTRFDYLLRSNAQFILETERTSWEPYIYEPVVRSHEIRNLHQQIIRRENRSKYFLIDKKTRNKVLISDLSQSVRQLIEAWENDMQLFVFIIRFNKPASTKWPCILEKARDAMQQHIIELWRNAVLT